MLVWDSGQAGTIGGGALELRAVTQARAAAAARVETWPLGPGLGQCCGGAVTLVWERFTAATLPRDLPFTRAIGGTGPAPARALPPGADPVWRDGWLSEAAPPPRQPLWIWGAGHVGRALVHVLSPLPDRAITWVDTGADRFPDLIPPGVTALPATDPARLVAHAPQDADHLILTYSHDLDLALCHALLTHGFASCGLIGSATKWARFRSRLAALGHPAAQIARIACPIGDPAAGKAPEVIALTVAAALICAPGTKGIRTG
jgi:xanthine dehydrogenase accessory factor